MLIGPLICALPFGDRSRAVEPAEHAAGRRYNGGNLWRAARNVNRGRASRAARRGLAGRRLVTPGLGLYVRVYNLFLLLK